MAKSTNWTSEQLKETQLNIEQRKKRAADNLIVPPIKKVEAYKPKGRTPHKEVQESMLKDDVFTKLFGCFPKFVFLLPPFTAPRMSSSDRWKKRPCVVKYWGQKAEFKRLCKEQHYELTDVLNIAFFIPMPESWSAKKKEQMLYKPHQQKPDRDNLLKAIQDSFDKDDSFVYDGRTIKIWSDKPMIAIF